MINFCKITKRVLNDIELTNLNNNIILSESEKLIKESQINDQDTISID